MAIVRLDANKVAEFIRLDDDIPLQGDEQRLYFRVRPGGAKIAATAFYFQEGYSSDFDRAEYGELRVNAKGRSLLVHMLDSNLAHIQPQKTIKGAR